MAVQPYFHLSVVVRCDHITHIIHAGLFAVCHKGSRIHGTNRKYFTGKCSMLDFDDFIASTKQYAVLANDCAAADRRNADLVSRTLCTALVAIINIFCFIGKGVCYCVCQH